MWNGSGTLPCDVVDPEPAEFDGRIYVRSCKGSADFRLRPEDEGEVWVRDHEGEDVDAFQAYLAMEDVTQSRPGVGSHTFRRKR